MAEIVLKDAFVSINAVDLSDHVSSVTISYSAEMLDNTAMGDDTRTRLGGLKDWNISIDLFNDYAASNVDATLFPLVGSTFTVIVRPDNTAGVGATNPNYTGTGILESYPPIQGGVGELGTASVTIQSAGDLSRATS